MDKNQIYSFFSGVGFLDLGFETEKFNVAFVNEIHKPFLDAYKHSRKILGHPDPKFGYYNADISTLLRQKAFSEKVQVSKLSGLVGFIGGPPCPDFSVAGKNRGKDGENGKLSETYVDLICQERPDFFLFENVKGLYRTKRHREFFESLKTKLGSNYYLSEKLINSLDYGAPQYRERIILVGFSQDKFTNKPFNWGPQLYPDGAALKFDWPETSPFKEGGSLAKPEEIPRELTVQHWFEKNSVVDHPNAKHHFIPRAALARFESICEGDDKKKSYKRLHRWRYSPTVAYGNNEVHIHPYRARRLSAAEALSLQSLPKEFELPSDMTLTNMFKCIGNGVPYLAALGLAKGINTHINLHLTSSTKIVVPESSAA